MLAVTIKQIVVSNMGFAVLLKSPEDPRILPIVIGPLEAQAIAMVLDKMQVPRPMTHDLFKATLDLLSCTLARVEITALREGTFFARLLLDCNGEEYKLDARPSDAMALALRCGAPIFAAREVMENAGIMPAMPPEPQEKKSLDPVEQLKKKLARAVQEERFEDAARLRDEIKKLTSPN